MDKEALTRHLVETGKGQIISTSAVRHVLAVAVTVVALGMAVLGREVPEFLVVTLGMVINMYFEKGQLLLANPPSNDNSVEAPQK